MNTYTRPYIPVCICISCKQLCCSDPMFESDSPMENPWVSSSHDMKLYETVS